MMENKIKTIASLRRALAKSGPKTRRVVFTNGCFDILHVGHVEYLCRAKALADMLVVGLNSDRSVRMIKGAHRPVNRQHDRAKVLAALTCVDYVVIFNETTPEKLIRALKPDVLVKGGDWKVRDIAGGAFVRSYGGRVVTVPFVKGYSTTALIRKMCPR